MGQGKGLARQRDKEGRECDLPLRASGGVNVDATGWCHPSCERADGASRWQNHLCPWLPPRARLGVVESVMGRWGRRGEGASEGGRERTYSKFWCELGSASLSSDLQLLHFRTTSYIVENEPANHHLTRLGVFAISRACALLFLPFNNSGGWQGAGLSLLLIYLRTE